VVLVSVIPFNDAGPSGTGLEFVQNELYARMIEMLPAQIDRQQETWDEYDKQFSLRIRQPFSRTKIEKPVSYYPGARLGVLKMPWDSFPAVAVMADRAEPTVEDASFDQSTRVFAPSLYVEGVIRSDTYQVEDAKERVFQEGVADRRSKRTIEAIVACVDLDPTLGGLTPELATPRVAHTDPFTLDGSEPGQQHLARVFTLINVQYSLDFYSARLDGGQPMPGILPMDGLVR
jgi:hypothetical protein